MAKDNRFQYFCILLITVELQDPMQLESSQTNLKKEVETMQRIHYAFSQYYHAIEIAFILFMGYARSHL